MRVVTEQEGGGRMAERRDMGCGTALWCSGGRRRPEVELWSQLNSHNCTQGYSSHPSLYPGCSS